MEYCYVYGFPWKHRCLPWLRLKDAVGDQVVVGDDCDGGDQVDEAWDEDNISAVRHCGKAAFSADTPPTDLSHGGMSELVPRSSPLFFRHHRISRQVAGDRFNRKILA